MTPDERNQIYETLMMRGAAFSLIIKRAKQIRADSTDKYIYHTVLKKNCYKNAKDILDMAESIKHRADPVLKMIEKQRQTLKEDNHEKTS